MTPDRPRFLTQIDRPSRNDTSIKAFFWVDWEKLGGLEGINDLNARLFDQLSPILQAAGIRRGKGIDATYLRDSLSVKPIPGSPFRFIYEIINRNIYVSNNSQVKPADTEQGTGWIKDQNYTIRDRQYGHERRTTRVEIWRSNSHLPPTWSHLVEERTRLGGTEAYLTEKWFFEVNRIPIIISDDKTRNAGRSVVVATIPNTNISYAGSFKARALEQLRKDPEFLSKALQSWLEVISRISYRENSTNLELWRKEGQKEIKAFGIRLDNCSVVDIVG